MNYLTKPNCIRYSQPSSRSGNATVDDAVALMPGIVQIFAGKSKTPLCLGTLLHARVVMTTLVCATMWVHAYIYISYRKKNCLWIPQSIPMTPKATERPAAHQSARNRRPLPVPLSGAQCDASHLPTQLCRALSSVRLQHGTVAALRTHRTPAQRRRRSDAHHLLGTRAVRSCVGRQTRPKMLRRFAGERARPLDGAPRSGLRLSDRILSAALSPAAPWGHVLPKVNAVRRPTGRT